MTANSVALLTFCLAVIPCGLFLVNLAAYRRARPLARGRRLRPISVLLPARNEAENLPATLESILASQGVDFEVVVLDDHSTDRTESIVLDFARRDRRVRLERGPALPDGWCGKQHACSVLAARARHPLLVFMDADVRLTPDALGRLAGFLEDSGAALASGVPHQQLGTFGERLLLPLIHFVLLGFLPIHAMRRTRSPGMSAGCGQLFIADAAAYHAVGGHAAIRATLHDGLMLPRLFRRHGRRTDLFDATDLASCRMYRTGEETWRGLGKNATEGLGSPGLILPMTALLLGGQCLPFVLLAWRREFSALGLVLTVTACAMALLPRFVAAWRFRQSWLGALLHPLGIAALLLIQWQALFRRTLGRPARWKGRSYGPAVLPESIRPT